MKVRRFTSKQESWRKAIIVLVKLISPVKWAMKIQ